MTARPLLTPLTALAAFVAAYIALSVGADADGAVFEPLWPLARAAGDERLTVVIDALRLPRAAAAAVVGAALAVAGLVLQRVSANPLADPYLLGVSGGAGLAVTALIALPGPLAAMWPAVGVAAFIGALTAVGAALSLARALPGRTGMLAVVLAGLAINAAAGAVTSVLLARFDPFRLRLGTTWLAGGVQGAEPGAAAAGALVVAAVVVYLRRRAHELDALALGADGAAAVGVDAAEVYRMAGVAAGLLGAVAVAVGGLVGWVGLIVPHAVRLLGGARLAVTLVPAALGGAALMLSADAGARTIVAPDELPAGVLTALVGAPWLLAALRRLTGARP